MPRRLRLGVQDDGALVYGYQGDPEQWFDRAREMGARQVRMLVRGDKVGEQGWQQYDDAINRARKRGMRVHLTLHSQPSENPHQQAANLSALVKDAASRYRGRVRDWSLMNEPDYPAEKTHIAGGASDPRQYRRLYEVGRRGLKQADERNRVFLGETSPHVSLDFLHKAATARRRPLVAEGYAHHPYQGNRPPSEPTGELGLARIGELRDYLERAAGRGQIRTRRGKALPVYGSEFGYSARGMPEGRRARYLRAAINKAEREGLTGLNLYGLVAPGAEFAWDTSLLGPEGRPSASFSAIRSRSSRASRRK